MEITKLEGIKRNDRLIVAFGTRGTQEAIFCRWGTCQGHRSLVVKKWRKSSKRWTEPVHVLPGDVVSLGRA